MVELQGAIMAVQVTSAQGPTSPLRPCSLRLQDSLELGLDPLKNQDSMLESIESESGFFEFSDTHGKNIQLMDDKRSAFRTQSYNHAMVCVTKPLCKGHSISVSTKKKKIIKNIKNQFKMTFVGFQNKNLNSNLKSIL